MTAHIGTAAILADLFGIVDEQRRKYDPDYDPPPGQCDAYLCDGDPGPDDPSDDRLVHTNDNCVMRFVIHGRQRDDGSVYIPTIELTARQTANLPFIAQPWFVFKRGRQFIGAFDLRLPPITPGDYVTFDLLITLGEA